MIPFGVVQLKLVKKSRSLRERGSRAKRQKLDTEKEQDAEEQEKVRSRRKTEFKKRHKDVKTTKGKTVVDQSYWKIFCYWRNALQAPDSPQDPRKLVRPTLPGDDTGYWGQKTNVPVHDIR